MLAVDDFELELEALPDVDDFDPAPEDLAAVDLLAVDLAVDALADDPEDFPAVAVFEPAALLAVAFDAEDDDFPAEVFDVPPLEDLAAPPDLAAAFAGALLAAAFEVDFEELLAAVDFEAVFEPEDLLAAAAFVGAAFFVEDEAAFVGAAFLFAAGAAFVIADFLFAVVDFVELFAGFLVAIFFSLKCV